MSRTSTSRTFTACWTCRRRNIGCDAALPSCSQCKRSCITCEGYHFNLVWVDSETGYYVPQQRRAYPCHITWQGYPMWTLKEVDHLIRDCEYREERQCRCRLHRGVNPFTAFPQAHHDSKPVDTAIEDMGKEMPPSPRPIYMSDIEFQSLTFGSPRGHNTTPSVQATGTSTPEAPTSRGEIIATPGRTESNTSYTEDQQLVPQSTSRTPISLNTRPTQPWNVDTSYDDNKLFHHFLSCLSRGMIPVDDQNNPWKIVYPSLAMQTTRSGAAQALYHALLAQSAYHVANLRGAERGAQEKASAVRHYGIALHRLRQSLIAPSEDYTTVMAALYTIILAEHVFQGSQPGWQNHICGARGLINAYWDQQPWRQSQEAYIVTQNFALSVLISSTVDSKYLFTGANGVSELDDLLHDLMTRPVFGYTLGSTPHILRALYQTRLLEAQINARGGTDDYPPELDADMFAQVGKILELSYVPLADKLETYVNHRELNGITVLPRMRTLTRLHLRLFNTAVMIYLFCVVLRCPPSSMAKSVLQVLRDATTFVDMHDGTVSIWPVFVAAAEAYTPESQALATQCLEILGARGAGNRREIHRVVRRVWSDRGKLARARQCDPGEVLVDWRQVMKKLKMDILLL